MPVLENARWELVAQGIAKGKTQEQAYIDAGYSAEPGLSAQVCASQLLSKSKDIPARIAEIQAEMLQAATLDRARTTALALDDRERARSLGQMGPAVAALGLAAKVNGLIIDKSLNINADLDDIPLSRLQELDSLLTGSRSVSVINVTPSGSSLISDIDPAGAQIPDTKPRQS